MREIKRYIESQRATATPFDYVFGGDERSADVDKERDYIRAMAETGATWWGEFIEPRGVTLDEVRRRIQAGPLRID